MIAVWMKCVKKFSFRNSRSDNINYYFISCTIISIGKKITNYMKHFLSTIAMLFLATVIFSQTYYVATTGNDANNGSQATPWKTISKATSAVAAGIIHVMAGTYTETVQSNLKPGVSLEGEGKANTIIKITRTASSIFNATTAIDMQSANNTNGNQSISDLTLDGGNGTTSNPTGTWVGIMIVGRSNVKIYNCAIKNFYFYGVVFQGNNLDGITATTWTSGPYATGNKFYNNEVTNCAGVIAEIQGGSGCLGIGWQDGLEIYNNSIINTARPAGTNGWPIKFWSNGYLKGVKIYNNTLIRSPFTSGSAWGGTGEWDFALEFFNVQGMEVYNNTIQGSLDVNYTYKGAYPFGIWVHHNTFNNPNQNYNLWESAMIFEFKAENIIVENNIINNRAVGISYNTRGINNNGGENTYACNYGGAIGGCSGIINNVIRNNVFSNLYPRPGAPGGIVTISEATNDVQIDGLHIYNNVFSAKVAGGTYNGIDLGGMGSGANVKNVYIRNNIFQNFTSNPIVKQAGGSQTNIQITNNDFFNNNPNTISWTGATQSSNQTVNPLFVSSTDFHLQPTSPLIDAGFTPLLLPSYAAVVPFNGIAPDLGYSETGTSQPPVLCTSYTYSAWSACVNGVQTRTVTSSLPAGCTGGTPPVLTQNCTVEPPACTYTYSSWSTCVNGVQTRTVLSTSPAGCVGTPVLSQTCTPPPPPGDTIYCSGILHFPTSGSNTVIRNVTYIVKRTDGLWYVNVNGVLTQRNVVLYQIGTKWYLIQ
jgi:hypothetical protein